MDYYRTTVTMNTATNDDNNDPSDSDDGYYESSYHTQSV